MSEEIVVVGGGPAASAAAAAYREAGGEGALTILCGELEPPYERPPLTKDYLRGESSRPDLYLQPPEWYRDQRVELELGVRVAEVDLEAGEARGEDGRGWSFDRCLLATGARPLVPDLPGADGPDVRTMRTIADSEQLRGLRECSVLVVGTGFIGCEAAASLAMLGAEVTVAGMEAAPQLERLGEEAAARIAGWLEGHGAQLWTGAELTAIEAAPDGSRAHFADGRERRADAVVLAFGIERNDELAAAAGLPAEDGVDVDERMVSADPRLLAAGDVAHARNAAAGRRLRVEHWGEALNMGEVAGRTLAGAEAAWDAAPGFWSTIGEHDLKYAGWGEGFAAVEFEAGEGGSFAARYRDEDGELVGVLAHRRDDAYEAGREELQGHS